MSEEHKQHNHDLFQTSKQDDLLGETEFHEPTYPETGDGGCYGEGTAAVIAAEMEEYEKKEGKVHKNNEYFGELGALASASVLHDKHEAKKDAEDVHKHKIEEEIAATHKIEEEIAATAGVGDGGFAFHEHHEKKEAKE